MNLLKVATKSSYFLAVKRLAIGSLIAQVITAATSPFLTRLYTPEQIGIYTLILTLSSVFGPIICARYDLVIVSAKEEEVPALMVGSSIVTLILSFIFLIGFDIYLNFYPSIKEEVGIFGYIIIPVLILTGVTNILTSYNNRYKEYKTISNVNINRAMFQNSSLILFGILNFGSVGLLISKLLGTVVGVKKQSENLLKNLTQFRGLDWYSIKAVLSRYRDQPLFSTPAQFLNSSSYSILNLFITGLFGLKVFGYYSITYTILGLPLRLISINVSKVFFQKATEHQKNQGSYTSVLLKTTLLLMAMAIPIVIILILLAPFSFKLIFGDDWELSGVYAQILAPMYGIRMIVAALTPALIISGKQKLELLVQSLFIITSILGYLVCKFNDYNIFTFLTIISFSYSLIYLILYAIIYKLSKTR